MSAAAACRHESLLELEEGAVRCRRCQMVFYSANYHELDEEEDVGMQQQDPIQSDNFEQSHLEQADHEMEPQSDPSSDNVAYENQAPQAYDATAMASNPVAAAVEQKMSALGLGEEPLTASELACIALDELNKHDVVSSLLESEHKYRVFNTHAKYLKYRRIIVDWMSEVGEESQFSSLTIHMGVRYLDRILSVVDVHKTRLQLVAMACILIAAKYCEPDWRVPRLDDLNHCSNNAYTPDLIRDMEIMVLKQLDWCLEVVTPVHFINYYFTQGVVFPDDIVDGKGYSRKAVRYVRKFADFFKDFYLQEHAFQQYPPSLLAASILASSRRAVKIEPLWNQHLTTLTTYTAQELCVCFKHLYSHYEASFPTTAAVTSPQSVLDLERTVS